jgi:hypothetical protein
LATPRNTVEGRVNGNGFLKCINLILKKIKTKNFRKRAEGVDSQMRAVMDAVELWIYKEG